jgi:hypothetical protein
MIHRRLLYVLLLLSFAANVSLATILLIALRGGYPSDYPTEYDLSEYPSPELPESLTPESVRVFLDELGRHLESKNQFSSMDPEVFHIRFLWPRFAAELVDAGDRYWSISSFLGEAVDSADFPLLNGEVLLDLRKHLWNEETINQIYLTLRDRGEGDLIKRSLIGRLDQGLADPYALNLNSTEILIAMDMGLIDDVKSRDLLASAGSGEWYLAFLLRRDPLGARDLVSEIRGSPHLLQAHSHSLNSLLLLAEAGLPEAIPLAASLSLEQEWEIRGTALALSLLIIGDEDRVPDEQLLQRYAQMPPDKFLYDDEKLRYRIAGGIRE